MQSLIQKSTILQILSSYFLGSVWYPSNQKREREKKKKTNTNNNKDIKITLQLHHFVEISFAIKHIL